MTTQTEAQAEQPAQQEPVATEWERIARAQNAKLMAMCNQPGGMDKLREVLLAASPQAQPAPEIAIADAYRAGVDSGIAAEREACAKVCESQPMRQDIDVREQCAAAIRARGNT